MRKPVVVVLVNLGSPEKPEAGAVARFLRPFLGDRRVVEIPRLVWWPILNGIVIPRRAKRVAENYRSIWMDEGSPIRVYTENLAQALERYFQEGNALQVKVRHAMTYGSPSIARVFEEEQSTGVERFVVIPLYPQYSATTTAAVYDQISRYCLARRDIPDVHVIKHYFDRPEYIKALGDAVHEHWERHGRPERLLMSFHGIPQRNVDLGDPYRGHCEQTAELLAAELNLERSEWGLAFQSRFGPAQWLQPYTDDLVREWAAAGVKNISVISPAFAADCLETLEEISQEYREVFLARGGRDFNYIPCLNDSPRHVEMLANLTARYL